MAKKKESSLRPKHRVAIYGGIFDPPTTAHLDIIHSITKTIDPHQLWIIVRPPGSDRPNPLADIDHRVGMMNVLIEEVIKISSCPIFLYNSQALYHNFLRDAVKAWPDVHFITVMGSDEAIFLDDWEEYESIISNSEIMWCPRDDDDISGIPYRRFLLPDPECNFGISSTIARELLIQDKEPYCVPEAVIEYIAGHGLYSER